MMLLFGTIDAVASELLGGLDTQLGFCKVMDGDAPHNANIGITLGYKF